MPIMQDERQLLLDAKALIVEKKYDAARRMLQSIGHNPTAQKWLEKLDEIAPPPPPSPFDDPDDDPFADSTSVFGQPPSDPYGHLTEEQKFERIKGLLQAKSYAEARTILETLPNNPSAQKLLAKLHQVAPAMPAGSFGATSTTKTTTSSFPTYTPTTTLPQANSDPFGASTSSFGQSSQSSTFGQPATFGQTIPTSTNSIVTAGSTGVAAAIPLGTKQGKRSKSSKSSKKSNGMAAGIGTYLGVKMMRGIFGFAIAIIIFIIRLAARNGLDSIPFLSNNDDTYENSAIAMTYSNDWVSQAPSSKDFCVEGVGSCLLYLDARTTATSIILSDLPLNGQPHQTIVNTLWQGYQDFNPGLQMVGQARAYQLDGVGAVSWEIQSPTVGHTIYGMVIYIPTATSVIEFSAWSNSESIFNRDRAKIQEVIDTIDVKQPPPT